MFDDVKINVLYNVVNTIVLETITSVEMFVALQPDAPEEIIDVVEDIFEVNIPVESDLGFELEPIEMEEITYESIEIEIAEIQIEDIQVASIDVSETMADVSVDVQTEIEMELEIEVDAQVETEISKESELETNQSENDNSSNDVSEPNEVKDEVTSKENIEEVNEKETSEQSTVTEKKLEQKNTEQKQETDKNKKSTVAQKKSSKEKAAKKLLKKIDDKQKYDSSSQIKTLVVMQVLGNSKTFFDTQQQLNDRVDFFTDTTLPDAVISDNDIASYFLFVGSHGLMNEMIESQYESK